MPEGKVIFSHFLVMRTTSKLGFFTAVAELMSHVLLQFLMLDGRITQTPI